MNCGARMGALIALLGAGAAHASSIVSSDIQSGDLFGPGVAIGIVPFVGVFNYAGIGFTPSQTYTFDSAELAISLSSGPNVLDVYLMGSNSSGLPSGILESFDLTGALSADPATSLVTIDSVTHPVLDAGVEYWLVAAGGASTTAFWQQNVYNVMGPNVSGSSLTSLVLDSDTNVIEAYEINGDAAVPEPQSWMLMVAGAIGLVWCARRKPRPRVANDGADAGQASDIPLPE